MGARLVGAVWMSVASALVLSACSDDPTTIPPDDGDRCAGVERICSTPDECPTLQTCSECGACVVDQGYKECESTADCSIGRACRLPEGGQTSMCVHVICDSHDECLEGEACNPHRKTCVPGDCVALGCPQGTVCREADSTCVDCLSNAECAGTDRPYCAAETATCVKCDRDSHCPGRCVDHECVACRAETDCAATTPICTVDGRCVACLLDTDCPNGVPCLESGRCDLGPIAGEDCAADRKCAPDYRCEGSGLGICFLDCNPYSPACPEGESCALLGDDTGRIRMQGGRPVGACVFDAEGRTAGATCSDTLECRVDLLCIPQSATEERCRKPCNSAAIGQCAAGEECKPLAVGSNDADVGFCMPPTSWAEECGSNSDCGVGLGCFMTIENRNIIPVCEFTTATGEPLAACDSDEDCRSGTCLGYDGALAFCWGACEVDAHCHGGTCGSYTFELEGGRTAEVSGCRPTCGNDADCRAYPGYICGVTLLPANELASECTPATGDAGPGDFCLSDDQCGSGICFSDETTTSAAEDGFCLGPCETNADCGTGTQCRPAALTLGQAPLVFGVMNLCWGAACSSNAGCPAGRICDIEPDPANPKGAIRYSCGPALGDLGPGESCATSADCMSGACVSLGYVQICYGVCATNGDCSNDTYCEPQAFTYTTPDGTERILPGCLPYD